MDRALRQRVLDTFGERLMVGVRDEACEYLRRMMSGKLADASSKQLFHEIESNDLQDSELVTRLITMAVDAVIVRFLHFLDINEIGILYLDGSNEVCDIRALSDGLAGELYSPMGWIERFSAFDDRLNPKVVDEGQVDLESSG